MKEYQVWVGTVKVGRGHAKTKTVKIVGEELCYRREDKGHRGVDIRIFRQTDGTILVYKVDWSRMEGDTDKAKIYKIK